jgi:hypothetical protein
MGGVFYSLGKWVDRRQNGLTDLKTQLSSLLTLNEVSFFTADAVSINTLTLMPTTPYSLSQRDSSLMQERPTTSMPPSVDEILMQNNLLSLGIPPGYN